MKYAEGTLLRVADMSLPSRERGLKFPPDEGASAQGVAPFAGAWIEICVGYGKAHRHQVAPFAGAWIEIIGKTISSISD